MGGGPAPESNLGTLLTTTSSDSLVEITSSLEQASLVPTVEKEDEKFRLLYARSKVYVYPTAYARDNVPGWIALVKQEVKIPVFYLSWIPETLLERKGRKEQDKFVRVESADYDEEDGVLIDPPVPRGESYAFSVPLSTVYSFTVQSPTLSSWYGSITINLDNGSTLPSVHFHDDESHSLAERPRSSAPTPKWGGEDLLQRLTAYCNVLRSSLQSNLYLVDPSVQDIEAHSTVLFDDTAVDDILNPVPSHRRPSRGSLPTPESQGRRRSLLHETFPHGPPSSMPGLLNTFSHITQQARHAAQTILSHPLAQPIVPHLPEPVRSLVNVEGKWAGWVEKGGVGEYESARVYLARWARIVAEAGEKARRLESQAAASDDNAPGMQESSDLGVFEVLAATSNLPTPKSTRNPNSPILETEWDSWFSSGGRPMVEWTFVKQEIFRRGLSEDVRPKAWPFLLGVFDWTTDAAERERIRDKQKAFYESLKSQWYGVPEVLNRADVVDERHRIDVDCRRTDRTQPLFAMPEEEQHTTPATPIGQSPANEHIERLMTILTTYNFFEKELGYVQGMSDLCSPLYVVCEGDEAMTFWCFVRLMDRMKQNFLRDQSGMRKQLLTLQLLLAVVDPELYRHLEKTESLNLFFCFRWILIAFKREFSFEDVMRLWEVVWTDYYSDQFILFVALGVLESHRTVILRYLVEFDEILKYCNELSMTIELDSTLAQAEVLFLSFAQTVADIDRRRAERDHALGEEGLRHRANATDKSGADKVDAVELPVLSENLRELLQNDRG